MAILRMFENEGRPCANANLPRKSMGQYTSVHAQHANHGEINLWLPFA